MPRAPRAKIEQKDLSGLKHFAHMQSLLKRLHQVGCRRDRANNRELHFDQYCLLILLHLFNPIITSLRGLQQASELKKVRKKLGVTRASLGSLSESVQVFDNSVYEVLEERELTDADREQGVLSDQVVRLGQSRAADARPNHPVRLVIVEAVPHVRRGKYRGGGSGPSTDGKIRLATDRLDVPAELIRKLYRLRWLIELFFRIFKGLLGCRHLLSTKQNGVKIHAYLAIIACLLILIHTGRTPTKRTFEMICFYLSGWADLEELAAHIARLKPAQSLAA